MRPQLIKRKAAVHAICESRGLKAANFAEKTKGVAFMSSNSAGTKTLKKWVSFFFPPSSLRFFQTSADARDVSDLQD